MRCARRRASSSSARSISVQCWTRTRRCSTSRWSARDGKRIHSARWRKRSSRQRAEKGAVFASLPPVPHSFRSAPMLRLAIRTATIAGAIVAAACVYDAPVTAGGTSTTAANVSNGVSAQLASSASGLAAKSYVIDFTGTTLPPDIAAQVAAAGGTVTSSLTQIGVAVASSNDPGFVARVAKIKGVTSPHTDIAPNLDVVHSHSFVPGQPFNFDQAIRRSTGACDSTDTFWHGTHVAGIAAAPGQNIGTVGIAPDATIIGVKVLHCG